MLLCVCGVCCPWELLFSEPRLQPDGCTYERPCYPERFGLFQVVQYASGGSGCSVLCSVRQRRERMGSLVGQTPPQPLGPLRNAARMNDRLAEYGLKPHRDVLAKPSIRGINLLVHAWNTEGY